MGLGLSVGVQDFGAVGPVVVCVGGVVVDDDENGNPGSKGSGNDGGGDATGQSMSAQRNE